MNLFSIMYNIIILPIETIIEAIFSFELAKIGIAGVAGAVISVSLAVNFLSLPIYNKAERIQQHERDTRKKLSSGIKRIKETFKGDEQFMMLQTFYRENSYHPLYALRSSLSIMIEIPFFIAAYHFLSHCIILQGSSFAFIHDMGSPDALLMVQGGGQN